MSLTLQGAPRGLTRQGMHLRPYKNCWHLRALKVSLLCSDLISKCIFTVPVNFTYELTWKLTQENQQMASSRPQIPCIFVLAVCVRASRKGPHIYERTRAPTVLNMALHLFTPVNSVVASGLLINAKIIFPFTNIILILHLRFTIPCYSPIVP